MILRLRIDPVVHFTDEPKGQAYLSAFLEIDMNAAIAWLLPRASTTSIASIESLVTIALFSGVGLLLSLSVLILDQNIPGEWF
jgi:hypothetical protein